MATPNEPVEEELPLDPEPPRRSYADKADRDAALIAAKADGNLLFQTLNITMGGDHNHKKCPDCGKNNLEVKNRNGIWTWKCHTPGCNERGGTVIDAIALRDKKDPSQVCREICDGAKSGSYRPSPRVYTNGHKPDPKPRRDREKKNTGEPKLDLERAEKFVTMAHELLLSNSYAQERYMKKKRGITLETAEKYRLGFIEGRPIDWISSEGRTFKWMIPAAWILPITGEDGKTLKAVKMHFEERPLVKGGVPFDSKSLWLQFGTEPKPDYANGIKPNHAYMTFWPHPATLHPERKVVNFTDDPMYWVKQIPEGSQVQEAWENSLEEAKLTHGLDISKSPTDFSGTDLEVCFKNAFIACRSQIQRAILKDNHADSNNSASDLSEYIQIHPGELKALAILSAGFMATSYTGGEGSMPSFELLSHFRRRRLCLFPDDDKPQLNPKDGKYRRPGFTGAMRLEQLLYECREKGWSIPEIRVIKLPRKQNEP